MLVLVLTQITINFNNKIMKDVINYRGCISAIYSKNNDYNNAKRGSSMKERSEVLGALKNEPDIKTRNTKN